MYYVYQVLCVWCVCVCARFLGEGVLKLGPNIIHYLDRVKPGNLQKIYLLSPPEVQCFSLLPRPYFFIYFSAVSCLLSFHVSEC